MMNNNTLSSILNENTSSDVVTRWESLGFLSNIEEPYKKYLADLYEEIAKRLINGEVNCDKLNLNLLTNRWWSHNETPCYMLEVTLFPIILRIYKENKTFTIDELLEALSNVQIDTEWFNKFNDNTEGKTDKEADTVAYISEKVINYLNN